MLGRIGDYFSREGRNEQPRKKNYLKESEHDADQGSVDVEENSEVLQRPNKNKRTKNSSTDNENDKFLETLQRSIEIRELFMLSLVGTLKKVPSERKMTTKIKMMTLLENAIRIDSPGTYHGHAGASHGHPEPSYGRPGISYGNPYSECSRSQPHQTDTYHSGFSTLPGGSEMTPSIQSPVSTVSEESSLLDMY